MDRLRGMEVFVRVVELGGFTRAAEALRLPKGTVTKLVQDLEAELGVRLLHRTTRRVQVTDDGAAYFEGAQRLLRDLVELDAAVTGAAARPSGRLRIDVPAAAGRHVIGPALPDFCARYPDIVVEVGSTDRPVDLLAEGVDCVIRGGLVHDESLAARKLGQYEVITCAAPAYLEAHGTPRTLDELDRHVAVNFFSAKTGRVFEFDFERGAEKRSLMLRHTVAANDADTHRELALAGLGLAQVPYTRYVDDLVRAGRLVPVLTEWSGGRMPLYAMYLRNRHPSARLRAFIDWAVALYEKKFAGLETARPAAQEQASKPRRGKARARG